MADVYPRSTILVPESSASVQVNSADINLARSLLNRFYYPVAVGSPEGAESFALAFAVIRLGPLTIGQLRFAGPVTLVASELDGYHVTLPTVGRVLTRQGGHRVTANPRTAAVFRPGNPVFTLHDAHSAEIDIKIDGTALERELSVLLDRDVTGPIDLPPAMDLTGGPGHSWSRLVRLVRDELPYEDSLIHQPIIAEQVRHSVLSGLLLTLPHRYRDELTTPARAGAPRAVRRALDAIRDEPERPFSVGDLAEIAGMSVRSLQESFRRHLGCTPMAHLQDVRLERAHADLRRADPAQATVSSVAHRWGFAHLGRFASAYRIRFGVTPSQTLRGSFRQHTQ